MYSYVYLYLIVHLIVLLTIYMLVFLPIYTIPFKVVHSMPIKCGPFRWHFFRLPLCSLSKWITSSFAFFPYLHIYKWHIIQKSVIQLKSYLNATQHQLCTYTYTIHKNVYMYYNNQRQRQRQWHYCVHRTVYAVGTQKRNGIDFMENCFKCITTFWCYDFLRTFV